MINSKLLKQILKSAKIDVQTEDTDISEIIDKLDVSEKEFLVEDYSLLIKIRDSHLIMGFM